MTNIAALERLPRTTPRKDKRAVKSACAQWHAKERRMLKHRINVWFHDAPHSSIAGAANPFHLQTYNRAGAKTMSFERHHPNRTGERNLETARDLRSEYLSTWLAAVIASVFGARRHRCDSSQEADSQRAGRPQAPVLHPAN